jgi:uncharacterized linocin/CFP29 family protein
MNLLKKELAPLTDAAWKEITECVKSVKKNYLTARKVVDIDGPHGMDHAAASTGRLALPRTTKKDGINYGIREVLPLIEVRKPFELDIWELDNIERGAMDIDLDTLEEATKQITRFEENVVYKGLKTVGIKGLENSTFYPMTLMGDKVENLLKLIGEQLNKLRANNVEGPYSMILTEKLWLEIINISHGYPVISRLKDILGGQVFVNDHTDKSYLLSERGGDYELTLGQDLSVGYDSHTSRKVKLFLTESFTFRVLSPEAVIVFSG